ncbi:MAG: hypothetical protein R6V58_11675 [Planctomycetota bacterium]
MMVRAIKVAAVVMAFMMTAGCAFAQTPADAPAAKAGAIERMPVKEVTVFKDGHAFVLHEGALPTDQKGNVVMDYLPAPVMGTFWPYSADRNVKLKAVVAGKRRVTVDRTALTVRELLEANVGAEVVIREAKPAPDPRIAVINPRPYHEFTATILGVPARGAAELEATSPPNSGDMLPKKGSIILLKDAAGRVRAMPIDRIKDVSFRKQPKPKLGHEEFRDLLTLKLDWGAREPEKSVPTGLVYLQRGIRWIPNYRVTIDGNGKATVKLQATLLNEMTDLEDVTAHLVIGVPTFAFKETVDPIALRQNVGQLSQYFRRQSQTAYALSNAMMTQSQFAAQARPGQPGRPGEGGALDLGPEIGGGGKSEDLFVFTVDHVTLRKGERMVLPVVEFELDYKDVYTLDLPFAPPPEVRRQLNNQRQRELATLFHAPKVMHKLRLENKSKYPLTTAPAMILRKGRLLGQGLMTYTAVGGEVDLPVTAAVDIRIKRSVKQTKQTPNAAKWHGYTYDRFDLAGVISLANHLDKPVDLEVSRRVLGHADEADHGGETSQLDVFDEWFDYPQWWSWYGWPGWWHHMNGVGRFKWDLTLEPGKAVKLNYSWHYFWRH